MSYGQSLIDQLDLLITQKYEEAERFRRTEHFGIFKTRIKTKKSFFSGLQAAKLVEKDASETQ